MSVSSEVQRTLVKSPPELWAELSDPITLARHLGELGEIRIVAIEPERTVDWEAAGADGAEVSGRVEIEPSGWGTKVRLSASRVIVEPADEAEATIEAETDTPAETDLVAEPALDPPVEPAAQSPPSPELAVEAHPEPEPPIVEEPEPEIIEPKPRPRFFARMFRRRRKERSLQPEPPADPEPDPDPVAEVEKPAPEEAIAEAPAPEATAPEEPASEQEEPTPETDISAELAELEEQTTAVLTSVLDRLGAAHHRPFSRA